MFDGGHRHDQAKGQDKAKGQTPHVGEENVDKAGGQRRKERSEKWLNAKGCLNRKGGGGNDNSNPAESNNGGGSGGGRQSGRQAGRQAGSGRQTSRQAIGLFLEWNNGVLFVKSYLFKILK